jgi:hypothetical protein
LESWTDISLFKLRDDKIRSATPSRRILFMMVLSRIALGVRDRTTKRAAVENKAALSSHVSSKVRTHPGPCTGADTFTRKRSTTPMSPPDSLSAACESYESQLLPSLDLERLQVKPHPQARSRWLVVSLPVVVMFASLAPIPRVSPDRETWIWRPALEWLVASISVSKAQDSQSPTFGVGSESSPVATGAVQANIGSTNAIANKIVSTSLELLETNSAPRTDPPALKASQGSVTHLPTTVDVTALDKRQQTEGDVALLPQPGGEATHRGTNAERTKVDPVATGLMLRRGREFLAYGDLSAARTVFRRAAEDGDANAALAMGATYDPVEFSVRGVRGIKSDIGEARRWYETAQRLGSTEASRRLQVLAAH